MTDEARPHIPDWLMTMPKVELHVHLEGTMTPATVWALAQRNGIDLEARGERDIASFFEFTDFSHFIDVFTLCSNCLRSATDLGLLVEGYGAELARQHVRYAEVHFNPEPHHRRRGIAMPDALAEMNRARDRVRTRHGVELRWIADGVRDADSGPVSVERTVDWMIEAGHESGVLALGLGGNEIGHPPELFERAFRRAREAGFRVVAHAGEATGPETIWAAIDVLGAERIGHGLAAVRDQRLLAILADRRIPLELSPTSNLRTRVIPSIEQHPMRTLVDAGVPISINGDDPPMFGTDLVTEYALACQALDLDRRGMARLVLAAIDQSFANESTKTRLRREVLTHTPLDDESLTPGARSRPAGECSSRGRPSA